MTCLCLTRNRREWLPKAIRCYQRQTYPNRELLILADGGDVRDLVPPDDSIRLVHLEGSANIGEKRNFGCAHADGEIIAHWDDDDYSAPGRLTDQIDRLLNGGRACTGYRSMRFRLEYKGAERWWLYAGKPEFALGTSLVYRRDWWAGHKFPALQIAEDSAFVEVAGKAGELIVANAGDFMYATVHDGNTCPRVMSGSKWKELSVEEGQLGFATCLAVR